jgi:hypothetical protein
LAAGFILGISERLKKWSSKTVHLAASRPHSRIGAESYASHPQVDLEKERGGRGITGDKHIVLVWIAVL